MPSTAACGSPCAAPPPRACAPWRCAWAGTAGLSYPVTRNLLVDTSYRFLHVGSPKTTLSGSTGVIDYGDMNAHELRVGLRYQID